MRQEFRDVRLDRLLEERDHLKIRIDILKQDPDARPDHLSDIQNELAVLEQDIAQHRPPRG
jgi:hypothetical protein